MGKKDARIDAYIAKAADFAKPVLSHLRELVHTACPGVEETWKWSFPNFMYKGAIMCNMAAFKEHCAFGFWKASLMKDADKILENRDKEGMGHMGKIYSLKDLPKDSVLKKYIKEAMKLNEEGVKLPARQKVSEKEKKELKTPDYFLKELKKNKKAEKVYNEFSYSKKKEYIEWFEDAKTEPTRDKRIAEALGWLAEGKSRNWKYVNC
jgi:uncharacterized protein YdeI (YjbR/CyaY-like superfamily)